MTVPYYVAAPGTPSEPPPMTLDEANQILFGLGWTAEEIAALGGDRNPQVVIAAAQAGQAPPSKATYPLPAGQARTITDEYGNQWTWNATIGDYQPQWKATATPGAAAATGTWQWVADLGVFHNSLTNQVATPEQLGLAPGTQGQLMTLTSGERLIEIGPDGTPIDVTPGGAQAGGNWSLTNQPDGLYAVDMDTLEVKKLTSTQMSEADRQQLELNRQQMALSAAEAGFPEVAFSYGGQQYRQQNVADQIMRGEQPQAAFEQRIGPGQYAPAPTSRQLGTEVAPGEHVPARTAMGIAEAVARAPAGVPIWHRLAGGPVTGLWGTTGGPYGAGRRSYPETQTLQELRESMAAYRKAEVGAPRLAGPVTIASRAGVSGAALGSEVAPAPGSIAARVTPGAGMTDLEKRRRLQQAYGASIAGRRLAVGVA